MGAAFGAPGEKKAKSLNEIKQDAITKFVSDSKGVTAFKDVTVNWTRDGKLHMIGTAYFDKLDDLNKEKEEKGPPNPGDIQPSAMFRGSFEGDDWQGWDDAHYRQKSGYPGRRDPDEESRRTRSTSPN